MPTYMTMGGLYAWPSFLHDFWVNTVIPHMLVLIILYAAIELMLGLLILNRGIYVKIELAGALVFGAGRRAERLARAHS